MKTVFLETALERARIKVAKVITNVDMGRRVFASPIYKAVDEYLEYRTTEIRQQHETHGITSARFSTIKSYLVHVKNYTQSQGSVGNSNVTRLDTLDENSFLGYAKYRRSNPFFAKDKMIRRIQLATIKMK